MPARYYGMWRRNATATATAIAPQRPKKRLYLCTTHHCSVLPAIAATKRRPIASLRLPTAPVIGACKIPRYVAKKRHSDSTTAIAPSGKRSGCIYAPRSIAVACCKSPPPNGARLRRSDCRQLQSSGRADEDRPCAGPPPCSIEAGGQGCGERPARAARASTGCSPQRCQRPTSRPGCARLVRASPKMTPGGPNECGPLRNLAVWERSGDGHVTNGRRTACRSARATPKSAA